MWRFGKEDDLIFYNIHPVDSMISLFFLQLQYLRKVRVKHEATLSKNSCPFGASQFNNKLNSYNKNTNSNSGSSFSNSTLKNSPSNHSQILGPLGKYLDILHSHST